MGLMGIADHACKKIPAVSRAQTMPFCLAIGVKGQCTLTPTEGFATHSFAVLAVDTEQYGSVDQPDGAAVGAAGRVGAIIGGQGEAISPLQPTGGR